MFNNENMITDAQDQVKYKIVTKDGREVGVKDSQMLAEMYINQLPEDLREGCRVIPVTDEGKQLLFG